MTYVTKSGIFVRNEIHLGLLTYSPFTGLFYACMEDDKDLLLKWLNNESDQSPSLEYERALGIGWYIDSSKAEYPVPNILPQDSDVWRKAVICAQVPIVINWLMTGNCLLNCEYCYAQDMMHGEYREPDKNNIENIVDAILAQNPLAVVLTGGDPLISPHLEYAIKLLHKKAGIIVDTSGLCFEKKHVELFKKYNVFVRISLDSEIPKINNSMRRLAGRKVGGSIESCSATAAFDAIIKCIDNNIKVAVQSVATKRNRSDLISFGDKLFNLGVSGWRILLVAPSKNNYKNYLELRGSDIGVKRFKTHILKIIREKQKKDWKNRMSIQIAENDVPNAIILVSPDGVFLTESNIKTEKCVGKVLIDPVCTNHPRLECIMSSVNMHAHTERYLNL